MSMINTTRLSSAIAKFSALAIALAVTGTAADAATAKAKTRAWLDIGAAERIDYSGRLHMLSQRIAAATCNMEAGTADDISRGILAGSADELDRIMSALRNGNALMKIIGTEKNPRIVTVMNDIENQWKPIRANIRVSMEHGAQQGSYALYDLWNEPFKESSNLLVSEVAAEYSDPADLLQRDAILVDIAGRQRMRTQKILKEACHIWKDGATDAEKVRLHTTLHLFDKTLNALSFGALGGFRPSPNSNVSVALETLMNDWYDLRPSLLSIADGNVPANEEIVEVYLALNEMLIKSDGIVRLYSKNAKYKN
jgi:nitrate/nitrite-specific signal transduction histidine kinase